jgi:hypothetical protein
VVEWEIGDKGVQIIENTRIKYICNLSTFDINKEECIQILRAALSLPEKWGR